MRRVLPLLFLVGGLQGLWIGPVAADPKTALPAKGEKLLTVTYDVADLVRDAAAWRSWPPTPALVPPRATLGDVEALVELLQRAVRPESWRPGQDGSNALRIHNGVKLEVRATTPQHAAIKDLLQAVRRLAGVSVHFEAELHEVEPAYFKKNIEPQLGGGPARPDQRFAVLVKDGVETQLRKQRKPLEWAKVSVLAGKSGTVFSLRHAFTYQAKPKIAGRSAAEVCATAFAGVSFRAEVTVSADRRRVRLKLSREVRELVAIDKEKVLEATTGKREVVEVPKFFDSTATATMDVDDGRLLLMPIPFRSAEAKDRGRTWVLLVRPSIIIDEEERARRNNAK